MSTSLSEQPTSKSLLSGLKDRDPGAWARVAIVYGPAVETWCRQSRLPEHEIDEVVQRVMLAVMTSAAQYRERYPTRSFRKWLWTVTRNKLADTYREVYRNPSYDPDQIDSLLRADGIDAEAPPNDQQTLDDTLLRAMGVVRDRVQPQTWAIFWRAVREEGTTADIAADFQTSPENVRQIKKRVLGKIHSVLELTDETPDV